MKKFLYLVMASSIIVACGGDADKEEVVDEMSQELPDENLTSERVQKVQMVFHTVPSPLETASIFQKAGSNYSNEYTNPVENVNKYATINQKALNLGVYGADLSYANIFDQSQESMFYMNCSKKMADGLGITAAFSPETMERIEENLNNRDSLMTIINDVFWLVDAHLKENGQDNLSALIITGGWIEGVYLGTKALNRENPEAELMERIAEQKHSLGGLMELLGTYNNEEINQLRATLDKLKSIFDRITEEEEEMTVSSDNDVAVIGGGTTLKYEPGTILEIAEEIENVRNEIIK